MSKPPFINLNFAAPNVDVDRRRDGSIILTSGYALGDVDRSVGVMLRRWAERTPDRLYLAERTADGKDWRKVTYGQANAYANAVAQSLLDRGLGPDRPVMFLSGNSVDNALLMLGAHVAGVPIAPASPAYSLMSQDYGKLKHIFGLIEPAVVFAEKGAPFANALGALDLDGVEVVVSDMPPDGMAATPFADLLSTAPTKAVDEAFDAVGPDTVAKYLFTSGSTGMPKGVINTHRMLCSNQAMVAQYWKFLEETPPVLVDWLPWNHTFGGNHNFNMVLRNGGTLYVDGGKPMPGLIEQTVANLREIPSTIHFNVPAGYNMILPFMERDAELRDTFFRNLQVAFYAAAALPQDLWTRLEDLSIQSRGERVAMLSAWGSTETAPGSTQVHWIIEQAGVIGLPLPGVAIKMQPSGSKMELRVKGPNIMPGYYKRPDLTDAAFDDEGYYCIGDAGKFADPDDPSKGLVFDGRVVEDFKLTSGTWVHVGGLRIAALAACSPVLQDALIAGHDRDYLAVLAWPNVQACKELHPAGAAPESTDDLLRSSEVVAHIRNSLQKYNADNPASSTRIARVMLMAEPPSIDANEITDKGYINQNAALARRAGLVERLYADQPDEDVIVI